MSLKLKSYLNIGDKQLIKDKSIKTTFKVHRKPLKIATESETSGCMDIFEFTPDVSNIKTNIMDFSNENKEGENKKYIQTSKNFNYNIETSLWTIRNSDITIDATAQKPTYEINHELKTPIESKLIFILLLTINFMLFLMQISFVKQI